MSSIQASQFRKTKIILFFFILISYSAFAQKKELKVITIAAFETGEIQGDFAGEAQLWYERDSLFSEMKIVGANSPLYYNKKGQGLIISGMGVGNASSTITALCLNKNLNLRNTYFLIAGIAGGSPEESTIGSVVLSDWVVNADLCHEVDAREVPLNWEFSRFRLGCNEPWCDNGWTIGSEVFQLNTELLNKAFELTKNTKLLDNEKISTIRKKFLETSNAYLGPNVIVGSNLSGNTFLYGKINCLWGKWWVNKWTDNKGNYVVSNMEDIGILTAFRNLEREDIVSFDRILIVRSISDFDQQYPNETVENSIHTYWDGFSIAIENVYRVGSLIVHDIINNWADWN